MKIVLVYNPKSGSALSAKELRRKCANASIEIEELVAIKDGFERKLMPYIKKNGNIAVIGGDGTVSAVAGVVAGTDAVLIPLPGGTLNHFTKDLGIPQDLEAALSRISSARIRKIDVAEVSKTVFINNSSIGLYPASLKTREELEDTAGKWPAAVLASLKVLFRFRSYTVMIDDTTVKTPFIFVGNNRYKLDELGGTERIQLDKGILTVFIAKTQSRIVLLKIALFALIGKASQLPEFEEFHPVQLDIQSRRRLLHVSHDGEVSKLKPPISYKIRAKALKIL